MKQLVVGGHQTDFQNSVGKTVIGNVLSVFLALKEVGKCRFKTVKMGKKMIRKISACGTPCHIEGQAFSKFVN